MNTVDFKGIPDYQLRIAYDEYMSLSVKGILPPGIIRSAYNKEIKINPYVSIDWVTNRFLFEMASRWYKNKE